MKNVNHVTGKMEVVTSVFPRITFIKAYHDLNPDVLEAEIAGQSSWCHSAFDCYILLCARCQRKQAQDNNNFLSSNFILAVCFSSICSSLTLLLRIMPLPQPGPPGILSAFVLWLSALLVMVFFVSWWYVSCYSHLPWFSDDIYLCFKSTI